MKHDPTTNPERQDEIKRLQRKIHELIEAASNDSKNHSRLIINPNISNEIATAITQLNILKEESADGVQQPIKIEPCQFQIIEQVARSAFSQKGGPHTGELDVEIVEERIENDDDEDVNPNPEGQAPKRKYSMKQRKVRRLLRLKVAKQAAYYAPIFDKPGKRRRFTLKHKLRVIKCIRFLNGIGCNRPITDAINVIYGQNQSQRQRDNNKRNTFRWLREEKKIVEASLKINGLAHKAATYPINLARRALSPASERNIYDKIVNNQKNNVITSKYKIIEYSRLECGDLKRYFSNTWLTF